MTDELKLPEGWQDAKVYQSTDFGGVREGERWTPIEAGQLFVGCAVVNDGVSLLRDLQEVGTDEGDQTRAQAIVAATDWVNTANEFTGDCVIPNIGDTDRSDLLVEVARNIDFLSVSINEHVHRIAHK